jgi:hypothetical protein
MKNHHHLIAINTIINNRIFYNNIAKFNQTYFFKKITNVMNCTYKILTDLINYLNTLLLHKL